MHMAPIQTGPRAASDRQTDRQTDVYVDIQAETPEAAHWPACQDAQMGTPCGGVILLCHYDFGCMHNSESRCVAEVRFCVTMPFVLWS